MVLIEQGRVLLAGVAPLSAHGMASRDFSPPVSLSGQQAAVSLWAPPNGRWQPRGMADGC